MHLPVSLCQATSQTAAATCMVDEHLTHRARRDGAEVRCALPFFAMGHLEISFAEQLLSLLILRKPSERPDTTRRTVELGLHTVRLTIAARHELAKPLDSRMLNQYLGRSFAQLPSAKCRHRFQPGDLPVRARN